MSPEDNCAQPLPEPQRPAAPLAPVASTQASPFDILIINPQEAQKLEEQRAASVPAVVEPELQEPEEEAILLPEQVERICKAVDRLARKGLNLRAVIALLHDAHPGIPKKHIKVILEGLRELPSTYGKAPK